MKSLTFFACLFFALSAQAQEYTVTINGKAVELDLNESKEVKVDGKKLTVELTAVDTLIYSEHPAYQFKHLREHQISSTNIEGGIRQIMMMTAEGSGVIFQEYAETDPAFMLEFMLSSLTEESIGYGYEEKREDYKRKISSGEKIDVLRSVLTYGDEQDTYEVASFSTEEGGVLILTMMSVDDTDVVGKEMINTMWKTLELKK